MSSDGITTRCEIRSKGDESRHITFCIFELSHPSSNRAAVLYFCNIFGNFLNTRLARRSEKGGLYQHGCWRCLNMEVERGQMPSELYLLSISLSHFSFIKGEVYRSVGNFPRSCAIQQNRTSAFHTHFVVLMKATYTLYFSTRGIFMTGRFDLW